MARVRATLERGGAAGAYFVYGDEEFLKEEAVGELIAAFVDPATRDFNCDQLRGSEVSADALASVLATPPMMAERRVVVVRDVQGLAPRARDALLQALTDAPPGLILIVTASIPSNSRAAFYETLKGTAASVEFGSVDAADLPVWAIARAADVHGFELEVDAARALAAGAAGQLGILAVELAKLSDFLAGRETATLDDVRAVGGYVPRVDRWSWFDLLGERRVEEMIRLLPTLLESGETGVGLVIGLTAQMLRIGLAVGGGREALEKQLKPYQRWMARRIEPVARRWSLDEVDAALAELLRTDRLLKTTALGDRRAIEELLLGIAAHLARDGASLGRAATPAPVRSR